MNHAGIRTKAWRYTPREGYTHSAIRRWMVPAERLCLYSEATKQYTKPLIMKPSCVAAPGCTRLWFMTRSLVTKKNNQSAAVKGPQVKVGLLRLLSYLEKNQKTIAGSQSVENQKNSLKKVQPIMKIVRSWKCSCFAKFCLWNFLIHKVLLAYKIWSEGMPKVCISFIYVWLKRGILGAGIVFPQLDVSLFPHASGKCIVLLLRHNIPWAEIVNSGEIYGWAHPTVTGTNGSDPVANLRYVFLPMTAKEPSLDPT